MRPIATNDPALLLRMLGCVLLLGLPAIASAHGSHGQLMEVVNKKLEASPEDANLWYQRGFLNLSHEDPVQAIADLERAEALAPGKLPTLLLKGQALESLGSLEEARASLDAHIERFPDQGRGYSSRARVLAKLGAKADSLADYRTVLSRTPDAEPDIVQESAEAFAASGLDEEAIEVLDAALKRLGGVPSLLTVMLEIELKAGRYEEALSRVDAMRNSALRPEPWMARRAEILKAAGRSDEARAAWRTLVTHLENLPDQERGSNSMSMLMVRSRQELAAVPSP